MKRLFGSIGFLASTLMPLSAHSDEVSMLEDFIPITGLCQGAFNVPIGEPTGDTQGCGCEVGFIQVGTEAHRPGQNPNDPNDAICALDWGSDAPGGGISDLPPELGGAGGDATRPSEDDDEPREPTSEDCQRQRDICAANVNTKTQVCYADAASDAAKAAEQGFACFGEQLQIMGGLTGEWVEIPPDRGRVSRPCTPRDLGRAPDENPERGLWLSCREQFQVQVAQNCLYGFPSSQVATTDDPPNLSWSIDTGFGKFGISGNLGDTTVVTVNYPPGTGQAAVCSGLRQQSLNACTEQQLQCLAKATDLQEREGLSQALAAVVVEDIPSIVARIDRERLGFRAGGPLIIRNPAVSLSIFRGLTQQEHELNSMYRARMMFLADWSNFIAETGISTETQHAVEAALQKTQASYALADDRLINLLIGATFIDPLTRDIGVEGANELLADYSRTGGLEGRAFEVEASLFSEISSLLSEDQMGLFRSQVWPGIVSFGSMRPMRSPEVIASD